MYCIPIDILIENGTIKGEGKSLVTQISEMAIRKKIDGF